MARSRKGINYNIIKQGAQDGATAYYRDGLVLVREYRQRSKLLRLKGKPFSAKVENIRASMLRASNILLSIPIAPLGAVVGAARAWHMASQGQRYKRLAIP